MALIRYGLSWPDPEAGVDPSSAIELAMAFNQRFFAATGWLGRYQHLRNAIDLIWNEPRQRYLAERKMEYDPRKHDAFIWNDWTELMMRALCENQWTTIAGPNASWKTTSVALYMLCAWIASPQDTICVLTSTTLDGLRRRIWKEVTRYYRPLANSIGNLVQSRNCIQFIKGSDDAGLFGIAVDQSGDVEKAVNKIIGLHAPNVFAGVDEMQWTNEAIVKGCISLEAGAERFEFKGIGNPESELDSFGQMCEPKAGWDSISVESESWETKRGVCIHLNGRDSPRVKEGDEFYPGLLRQSDLDSTIRDYGEDSPEFWSKRLGFWAPQGVTKTVLSAAMITKFKAKEKAIWVGEYKVGAAVDPAFEGGDRCILRTFHCGVIDGGTTVLALKETIIVKVQVSSEEPIHYQISRIVKHECEARNIPPTMTAIDSSGEGGGLASIMIREWGPGILLVEFGGRPSADAISETNSKRADQEYDRRVTELWYRFRTLVQMGQVRELDIDTATEFCQRRYEMKGNFISLETKTLMKQRTRRSPDLADAAVVGAELFRTRGLLGVGQTAHGARSQDKWRELARKYNNVESDYLVA